MPNEWKVEGVAPGLPEGARSATGGEPGATPSTFHSFGISSPFLLTRFYPKFVSRIIGGGALNGLLIAGADTIKHLRARQFVVAYLLARQFMRTLQHDWLAIPTISRVESRLIASFAPWFHTMPDRNNRFSTGIG